MPIQGTNAEMIKIAMIDIQKELISKNMISKMLIQIHDELVFEVPSEELDNLQKIVVNKMENSLTLSVPIIVDCGNGDSWYEAH
jgi:DNA polymerase-1